MDEFECPCGEAEITNDDIAAGMCPHCGEELEGEELEDAIAE